MKKYIVIIVLVTASTIVYGEKLFNQKYLDDLKNKPLELSDKEAQKLMDSPGLRDTISTYYVYAKEPGFSGSIQEACPKMHAGKFLIFPWSGKIRNAYNVRVVWYNPNYKRNNGWIISPILVIDEGVSEFSYLVSLYCIIVIVVILLPRIWLLFSCFLLMATNAGPSWKTLEKIKDRNQLSGFRYTVALGAGCFFAFVIHPFMPLPGDPLGYSVFWWISMPMILFWLRGVTTGFLLEIFDFSEYYEKRRLEFEEFKKII